MTDYTPIQIGDRYEDRDTRSGDRVVQVIEVAFDKVRVRVLTAEFAPAGVGRRIWLKPDSLRRRYRKVSH